MGNLEAAKQTPRFSSRLYTAAEEWWVRSLNHPFVEELGAGTLDPGRFIFYLKQDYLYLLDYARMYAYGSIKASDPDRMAKFAELSYSILHVEMGLHRGYAAKFGISREELDHTPPSPATTAYTGYMLQVAAQGTLAEIVAVILPCMWSYREIGLKLAAGSAAMEHPLYREWVEMYSSSEFGELTDWCIGLMDELAEGLPEQALLKLEEHFVMASKLEYLFWDKAYDREEWPV
ncbi:thiaminase II [Paenibacillus protaetiae]|uniref:Aminopyrimidine aminohydrolase n=1 Tax=Paenibacillus protaetiae TaxID=2509456 RepID=A0A4V0YF54_9BACL|nr:thiaminase II [Paenibacillus protaetiae]QAY66521.1 thiaminase II [Paenibacillus protaetiae]